MVATMNNSCIVNIIIPFIELEIRSLDHNSQTKGVQLRMLILGAAATWTKKYKPVPCCITTNILQTYVKGCSSCVNVGNNIFTGKVVNRRQ